MGLLTCVPWSIDTREAASIPHGSNLVRDLHTSDIVWLASAMVVAWAIWYMVLHRWRQLGSLDPMTWPVLGAQLEVSANASRIHDWCLGYLSEHHRTFTLRLFGGSTLHLTVDPDNLHHILKDNSHNYPKVTTSYIRTRFIPM